MVKLTCKTLVAILKKQIAKEKKDTAFYENLYHRIKLSFPNTPKVRTLARDIRQISIDEETHKETLEEYLTKLTKR